MEKITDFISGINVPATPEEVNATQPISKILFEDYGYPKDKIHRSAGFHVIKNSFGNCTCKHGWDSISNLFHL